MRMFTHSRPKTSTPRNLIRATANPQRHPLQFLITCPRLSEPSVGRTYLKFGKSRRLPPACRCRHDRNHDDCFRATAAATLIVCKWPVCDRRVRRSRPARRDYTSVCSAISSASSTSMPKYRTGLSANSYDTSGHDGVSRRRPDASSRLRVHSDNRVQKGQTHLDGHPAVSTEVRPAARFGDRRRDGRCACKGARAVCSLDRNPGGHHLQTDTLREWQACRHVPVPCVRLFPTSSTRSETKAAGVGNYAISVSGGTGTSLAELSRSDKRRALAANRLIAQSSQNDPKRTCRAQETGRRPNADSGHARGQP